MLATRLRGELRGLCGLPIRAVSLAEAGQKKRLLVLDAEQGWSIAEEVRPGGRSVLSGAQAR